MRRNSPQTNVATVNSTKSCSTKARDLMCKMAVIQDWHISYPPTHKFMNLRPHSSPCRVYSRNGFRRVFRPSSTTAMANPISSFLDVKRILFQKITDKGDELRKAFQLLDTNRNMTVSKSELKRIITTFLMPLTREQFQDVLAQIPLTSSGAVPYLEFLSGFGGMDLHINVIKRGGGNEMNCSRTVKELEIQVGEKIFKNMKTVIKAFKLIDVNKTGLVQPHELRKVLETFCLKMKDDEYKKFAKHYNIDKDTTVDYNVFLKNLSVNNDLNLRYKTGNPEVSWESQSVKNSKRECPHSSVSSEEVWKNCSLEEVETAFCQELSKSYGKVEKALSAGDPSKSGCVSLNYLKIVFDTFVYRLPRRIFIQLMKRFGLKTTARVNWKQFLTSLYESHWLEVNNTVPPTERNSITSKNQSCEENIIPKLSRHEGHSASLKKALLNAKTKPDGRITGEELRRILNCEVVKISDSEFKELMQTLDPGGTGWVNVNTFIQLLEENPEVPGNRGMPVDDDQYAPLTADVGHEKGGTSYLDLAAGLGDAPRNGPKGAPSQTPGLSKSNLDGYFVTAEDCVKRFPQRLKEVFRDPYSAFFKIDTDRDGIIHTRDVHRLLQLLLFNLKDDEFERFLGLLGLRLSVTLNFREFRNLCEKTSLRTDDPPQRLIRPKQKVADSELACEQAHQYLATKAKTRWSDLSKNFIETDSEGNGILRRRDIRNALYGFDIPLTLRELEKLWMSYDTDGRGHITYQEFLQKLGINYSADIHRPYAEDYFNFMGHFTKPQQVHEEARQLQQSPDRAAPARDKLKDHYQDISKALTKVDPSPNGYIPVSKMQEVLRGCGCHLKEEDLADLLNSWGIRWHDNSFNYLDFSKAVENSEPTRPPPREKEGAPLTFATLDPAEVVKSIREVVDSSSAALSTAFSALDKEDTGFVKASDFGQVLKDFCHKLTDNQYHYFLRKLKVHLSPHINWKYFLQNFDSFSEETAAEWAEKMPQGPPATTPKETAHQELLARIHKAVGSCYCALAQEFDDFDTMKTNTASRDEFRALCARHMQVLTDEQFDRLWSEMPVNAKGRLKYLDFLSMFSSERGATPPATGSSTKAQKGCSAPEVSERSRSTASSTPAPDLKAGLKTQSHPCTPASASTAYTLPLQNCEPIESKLRRRIQGCWREFLKECKEKDATKQGEITTAEFLALVEKFSLDISKEESQQLAVKYDVKNSGKFAYCDFIQSCVLLLKAKETSLMQRMKIQNANKMKEAGAETSSFYSALLRIQPQIVHCWRPMRRTFKAYDEGGTGLLSVADFRKVLRQHSINLSEEEFFHILEYYDKTLSSKISYNDFLRAFLQ
ncbi:EF-hand calcium-binding domain-containing protein 6 isoform X4 [Herpailurus yagouaroundi]|uniref:EF-hand calcium-binding domain-containing protein 6 isoform X4 n=1 Tax=Herpailurus yagouaroundi TaxID=1608482 RepID=UPI001AD6E1F9|nr:EF-hand calcium-binding domain-containing protein 6 isoform X4 [Puma yagouaroundi]